MTDDTKPTPTVPTRPGWYRAKWDDDAASDPRRTVEVRDMLEGLRVWSPGHQSWRMLDAIAEWGPCIDDMEAEVASLSAENAQFRETLASVAQALTDHGAEPDADAGEDVVDGVLLLVDQRNELAVEGEDALAERDATIASLRSEVERLTAESDGAPRKPRDCLADGAKGASPMPDLPDCPICGEKADPRCYRSSVMLCDGCWPSASTSKVWTTAVDRVLDLLAELARRDARIEELDAAAKSLPVGQTWRGGGLHNASMFNVAQACDRYMRGERGLLDYIVPRADEGSEP